MNLRCVILLCVPAALAAQDAADGGAPPDELLQKRRQFELRALASAKTLSEQFANALATIVKEAGTAGDYDQALAAQRRREQLVALYTRSLGDTTLANVILLKPAEARVNGAVTYDKAMNALVTWRTVGSVAVWDVSRLTPGSYDVTLTYAAADMGDSGRINPFLPAPDLSTGGEFEFYEDSSLSGAAQNRRTGQVASTGGWDTWATLTLPAIQITRSSARFALKITRARGTGGVMNLKEIRLTPAGAAKSNGEPAASPDDPPAEDELTKLLKAHHDSLKVTISPIVTAYSDSLKALAEKSATGDPDLSEDLLTEARRASALVEDPQSVLTGPARPARAGFTPDGFRELRGAAYVASKSNTGDSFRVRHEGEEFTVRLLRVSCPPVRPDATKALKEPADYFGTSPEDTLAVGLQAQAFTESFLSGKPLKLLTRGLKDADGNLLVSVHPEGVGDFAGVLVDNGLAMILPAVGRGPVRQHEESVMHALKEREAKAKARTLPPGAWALSNRADGAQGEK